MHTIAFIDYHFVLNTLSRTAEFGSFQRDLGCARAKYRVCNCAILPKCALQVCTSSVHINFEFVFVRNSNKTGNNCCEKYANSKVFLSRIPAETVDQKI